MLEEAGSIGINLFNPQIHYFRALCMAAVATLPAILFPPIVLSSDPAVGTITELRGTAFIKRPGAGDPLAANVGMNFRVGDVVEARNDSAVQLSLTDESFMNVAAGSSVRVSQYSFDAAANRRTTVIRVLEGRVRFVVFRLRMDGSSFRVESDTALVTAGGLADFMVIVAPGRSEIAVFESSLSVRNSLAYVVGSVNVGANQRTIVREKSLPAMPEFITSKERKELLKGLKSI